MTNKRFQRFLFTAALALAATALCGLRAQAQRADDDVNAAATAFREENYPQSAALFRKVVSADPANAAAWHFLGQSLEKTGDLVGARHAYQEALSIDPAGKVGDRTRPLLEKLALPDATRVVLPSGLTLLDWMNFNATKLGGTPMEVIKDASQYIHDYGPFPQLVTIRDSSLKTAIRGIDVSSADTARSALATIRQLRSIASDNLEVLGMCARAEHLTGDFAAAKSDYSQWLQLAPANSANRKAMAENLLKAGSGEPPSTQVIRPTIPGEISEAYWEQIEALDLYRKAPKVREVNAAYEVHQEWEVFKKGQYTLSGGNEMSTIGRRTFRPLEVAGCFQMDFHHEFGGQAAQAPQNGSTYACGGGYILTQLPAATTAEYTGSIFPLTTGATMTRVVRSPNSVLTARFTVGGKVDASTLHPRLAGDAWELEIHTELQATVEGKPFHNATDTKDVFIESLGVPESMVGALVWDLTYKLGKPGGISYVIPTDGLVHHGALGTNVRQTFSNTRFDLQ